MHEMETETKRKKNVTAASKCKITTFEFVLVFILQALRKSRKSRKCINTITWLLAQQKKVHIFKLHKCWMLILTFESAELIRKIYASHMTSINDVINLESVYTRHTAYTLDVVLSSFWKTFYIRRMITS